MIYKKKDGTGTYYNIDSIKVAPWNDIYIQINILPTLKHSQGHVIFSLNIICYYEKQM